MSVDLKLTTLKEHSRKEIFFCLARAPGSERIFVGASDGNIYTVDSLAEKPDFHPLAGHASFVTGVAVAGDLLVSGGYDCKLIWRTLASDQIVQSVDSAHSRWIRKVVASPDGRLVASVGDDMVCRLWEVPSGKLLVELHGHEERTPQHFPSMLYTCIFSTDGQQLATADKTGRICLWDVSTGAKRNQLDASGFYTWDPRQRIHSIGGTRSLAFTPDGKSLVAGGIGAIGNIDHLDGPARVELFDLDSGQSVHVFSGDAKGLVEQLVLPPEGKWLLGLGGDNVGFWQVYDLAEKKVVRSEKAPMHVHAAVLSEDATQLFAAGHGKITVWQIEHVAAGE
jgi:WD40 repeat protein